ncbi:MAG: GIY-YIG nuclease family protein [Candidatus Moranbacteria bacterium]|nr:GIY-YIG nuclease family protein [Candidatus Moranbacteria bacterium]
MHYVYSLKCRDGYYIGCTDNLIERLERHKRGYVKATKHNPPLELKFYFAIKEKNKAFNFERYLKTASGRAFIKKHFQL